MSSLADLAWYERARAHGARGARATHCPVVRLDGLSCQQLCALGGQHGSGDEVVAHQVAESLAMSSGCPILPPGSCAAMPASLACFTSGDTIWSQTGVPTQPGASR
jgi:hypothetical protein